MNNAITDIPGIEVGQAQDLEALTGVSVIVCRQGAVAGVDVRGSAPGTRETDLLNPLNLVEKVHAVVLAGGSAYGLDAASGVMKYLEQLGLGYETGVARVPIIPAAILFDLAVGRSDIRPDAEMGYRAAASAHPGAVAEGNVGAGTGASVGKMAGMPFAMKSGVGTASLEIGGGLRVAALVAVNAVGDVIDPQTGQIVAGARGPDGTFFNSLELLKARAAMSAVPPTNTVIGVVATNARLTKAGANKMASMAHDGLARVVRPAHTMFDGDTIFALATGDLDADLSTVGAFASEVFAQACLRAVRLAGSLGGLPGLANL